MAVDEPSSTSACNLAALDSLSHDSIGEIVQSWDGFCLATDALLKGNGDFSLNSSELISKARTLCKHGLQSLVQQHFLRSIEEVFQKNAATRFWSHFEPYRNVAALEINSNPMQKDEIQEVLCKALEEISSEKQHQEKCLWMLVIALQPELGIECDNQININAQKVPLFEKYQLIASSVLMTSLPRHFPEVLHWYFRERLEDLSTIMEEADENDNEQKFEDVMDVDGIGKLACRSGDMDVDVGHQIKRFSENNKLVMNIGTVVRNLRSIGLTSMAEDAYASAIFFLLKAKVQDLAGDDFRNSVWDSIEQWIQAVPLQFLNALLAYLGDSTGYACPSSGQKSPLASQPLSSYFGIKAPSEGLVRWRLRLDYFAYETLQDLRIVKLFEIIVDYPDSAPAIEDLRLCLDHTGQHAKLVDSFISSLRYRLLTAGASTNDILHQYVSTIKALRTIDPACVFLEAVGEPIREYLKGRKDTIKCIVTMLTDGTSGSNSVSGSTGDSLLEELNRDKEYPEDTSVDEMFNPNEILAWNNAQRWEPDPVEADSLKGSRNRRKVDILGMIVGIIGSKDQLINEYRVMLAEKLLNKYDYEIDSEIRTLELLKIHFGESSMQRCEIMLNDLIDSKRTNTNIKATIKQQPSPELEEHELSMDILSSTIISSNFWPPIQDESLMLPAPVDLLLSDYAKRFNQIKTPRKLLWKKNLGTVKLELQFEDKEIQFTVTPLQASIIVQFQSEKSWSSKDLAAAVGVPVDVLNRRISFWISKGILQESVGADANSHIFSLVEAVNDNGKNGSNSGVEELMVGDDDGERAVASVEDQLRKEMTVYEKFIMGMLTNFGSMALDRIHNTLKMFCVADPAYDKSLQQLQSFLSGLVAEEKLELRDGMYLLRK